MNIQKKITLFALIALTLIACSDDKETLAVADAGTVTDIDGNVYKTIKIGKQTWMVENLRTMHYRNGDRIDSYYYCDTTVAINASVTDSVRVVSTNASITTTSKKNQKVEAVLDGAYVKVTSNGVSVSVRRKMFYVGVADPVMWKNYALGFCIPYNVSLNMDTITRNGLLYNYYAATDVRNVAPEGWHVPTKSDWMVLIDYLNQFGDQRETAKMIAASQGWTPTDILLSIGYDQNGNNRTGFNVYPSGCRGLDAGYSGMGTTAMFWSTTTGLASRTAWNITLLNISGEILLSANSCQNGLSVRCVKD